MASTGKRARTSVAKTTAAAPAADAGGRSKIALALQGSFGHIFYAAGVLDAFRAHNRKLRDAPDDASAKAIEVELASGCVEMMTPLWLYLADQHGSKSLRDAVVADDPGVPLWARSRIAPPAVRPDAWRSYFSGLVKAQGRWAAAGLELLARSAHPHGMTEVLGDVLASSGAAGKSSAKSTAHAAELSAAWQDLCMYASGLPGQIAFNPLFVAEKEAGLEKLCGKRDGPTVFTNATRADDLGEIYLYSGTDPDPSQVRSMQGKSGKRQLLRLTPEYFFASGARPPYIDPVPVQVGGRTERWMEGAMRCNPPLTPLIDMGATHIVLLRFFCKDAKEEPNNNGELNERFIDAVFNIPLQKEIESIEFNSQVADCVGHVPAGATIAPGLRDRRRVHVLDPGDHGNRAHSASYTDFLHDELGALSHYDGLTAARRGQMFERGAQIGGELIRHLQEVLP